jgi:hypothetical protein
MLNYLKRYLIFLYAEDSFLFGQRVAFGSEIKSFILGFTVPQDQRHLVLQNL